MASVQQHGRRGKRLMGEINVVPYIDVMLVLLIIFMIVTPLIATAIGLFAAIPAVIAYNRYADQVSRLELRYDAFMEEFSTILQRYAGRSA